MAYDAMDRLTYANIPGHGASTWAYDPLDNIRSVTTAPTAGPAYTRSYLYDGSSRLTSITQDGATWGVGTYDARGNLIDRNGMTLVFDRASRLTAIPGVANYEYDGHGRRTAQWRADGTVRVSLYTLDGRLQGEADNRAVGSTDYIYLGGTLVAKRFQHWSGIAPVVTYLHSDGLGSPVLETDATGAVLSRERFLSYGGAVDGAVKDAVGYTGHQEDPASGLVYMQQRYYDPAIGRFLSVDPVGVESGDMRHFNRYAYAYNNPSRFYDPDGRRGGEARARGDLDRHYQIAKSDESVRDEFMQRMHGRIGLGGIAPFYDPTEINLGSWDPISGEKRVGPGAFDYPNASDVGSVIFHEGVHETQSAAISDYVKLKHTNAITVIQDEAYRTELSAANPVHGGISDRYRADIETKRFQNREQASESNRKLIDAGENCRSSFCGSN